MAKNVKKDGKKLKPDSKIQAFDLENITQSELKKYVGLLEKELALMRKDVAFYNAHKIKIMEFLEVRREVYLSGKHTSFVKNSEMDELMETLRKYPKERQETDLIDERENLKEEVQNLFHDFVERDITKADHLKEEELIKKQIVEKEKIIEMEHFLLEMTLTDLKEAYLNAQDELDLNYKRKLEDVLQKFILKYLHANKDFSSDKIRTLISIWNVKENNHPSILKESYMNEMKRLQDFFSEISSYNAEAIKILRDKLSKLLVENKKLKFHLKRIVLENVDLKIFKTISVWSAKVANASRRVSLNLDAIQNEKKLEKMQFKNDVLTQKLSLVEADLKDLKKQFISSIRKIYQNAEYKAYLVEEMIRMSLQEEPSEEYEYKASDFTRHKTSVLDDRDTSTDDFVNVINLTLKNADTLFVPPVYHEFWSSSKRMHT